MLPLKAGYISTAVSRVRCRSATCEFCMHDHPSSFSNAVTQQCPDNHLSHMRQHAVHLKVQTAECTRATHRTAKLDSILICVSQDPASCQLQRTSWQEAKCANRAQIPARQRLCTPDTRFHGVRYQQCKMRLAAHLLAGRQAVLPGPTRAVISPDRPPYIKL